MDDVLKRNNVSIYGEAGKPVMVFAHGYGCDQNVWSAVIEAFEQDYQIIVFDYVGAGKSDLSAYSTEKYASLEGYTEDIFDIYACLNLKDTILVAHSVSCMVGLLAAIKKPELFSKLIFIGPSPRYINDDAYHGGFTSEDIDGLFEMMDDNYLGWSRALAPSIMGNSDRPVLGESLTNTFCATDPTIAKQFARVTFLSDNRKDLPNLGVPSLTLQCVSDIIAPVEVGSYMNKNMLNNTLVVMNATGHCPHMSAPKETIDLIKSYLHSN